MGSFFLGYVLLFVPLFGPAWLAAQPAGDGSNPDSLKQLVAGAWQVVDSTYYYPTFNGLDWDRVRQVFQERAYANKEDAYAAIREMLARLNNRATRFLTPAQASALLQELSGRPSEGVGLLELLSVDTDERTGHLVVVTPVPGLPAARAGVRPGDVIVAIDGVPAAPLGLAGAAERLRGPAGTGVELTLRRGDDLFDLEIEREQLPALDPLDGFVRDVQGHRIGYLGLRHFTADAPAQMQAVFADLEAAGVAGYVLDLRNNPGGFLPAVQQIAGMFLGEVPIAYVQARSPERTPLPAQGRRRVDAPLVVLINEGSASAAEVLAGALQFHRRALLVGMPTFGKGLVHGFTTLSDGAAVMATTGRLQTPGGRDILEERVRPDVVIEMAAAPVLDASPEVATGEDVQYVRAVAVLLDALSLPENE